MQARFTSSSTLVDLLRTRARETPEGLAYVFLQDGEDESARLTWAELDSRARQLAAWLQRGQRPGAGRNDRALLLVPPGLDFIAAFFGCLYAGTVAVPSYPPSPPRPGRGQPRLRSILEDAAPRFVLTTASLAPRVDALTGELPGLAAAEVVATDQLAGGEEEWTPPSITADTLAFLQYTSGSTSDPKGVMVSHANLLHNEEVIRAACGHDERSTFVSWLPMYHDMGLIGGVLQPFYTGATCVLMAPVAFLQRPVRWLRAITRWRAHTSGAPDFAYDLCVRKISPEQREGLDLSSWRIAFDGAEPVRSRTLEAFTEAFAPHGFRASSFFPCYGLAEATLIVSGPDRREPPVVRAVQGLDRGLALDASPEDPGAAELVGCGPAGLDLEIAIVDPEAETERSAEEVGEIWVAGPSVAQGYWNRPELSERTFRAHLAGRPRPFLRTGDLGFLRDGQLFVTGRIKDLIIVRGRNLYPQDLERTAADSHPAVQGGAGAAFAVETAAGEGVVLVQELDVRRRPDAEAVLGAVRQALAEEHEVPLHAILLVRPGGVPKTTSGKVQRQLCRARFLTGELEPVVEWRSAGEPEVPLGIEEEVVPETVEELTAWLRRRAAARLGISETEVDPSAPLTRHGLDSLAAVELAHEIEMALGIEAPLGTILASPSLVALAGEMFGKRAGIPPRVHTLGYAIAPPGEAPERLSPGERALWFVQQLDPASPAYHIAGAARILGAVDEEALRRRFQGLVDRHPALRTTFVDQEGEPVRRVADASVVDFQAGEMDLEEEVFRPFDLTAGPLLRVRLIYRGAERLLVLVIHHLVADFWSLAVMLRNSVESGPGGVAGEGTGVRAGRGEDLAFWETHLAGYPQILDLPADRPRPARPRHRAAALPFALDAETAGALRVLARSADTTLFTTLLALFQGLLHRLSGQERLLVGAPTSGRSRAALAGEVGYFVNPVVLASELAGEPPFTEQLGAARRTVLEAFAREVPFPALVERLHPDREPGRSPLFQAAFALHRAPRGQEEALAAFALQVAGERLELDGLLLESVALPSLPAPFDLTLLAAEIGGATWLSLHYDTDLFDGATARRWADHLRHLAAALAADPALPLTAAPLWSDAEQWQVLGEWRDTEEAAFVPVHQRVAARAAEAPEAVAVRQGESAWTYGELTRRAWGLAAQLRRLGVGASPGAESLVAVLAERRPETLAAQLAVLAAGGAWLPIDPASPPERAAWLVRDSGARVLLAEKALAAPLPAVAAEIVELPLGTLWEERAAPPRTTVDPLSLAYVIYTSGSTGEPKGVAVSHGALASLVDWHRRAFELTPRDVASHLAGLGFDAAVWEVWPTLAAGASLRLPPEETAEQTRLAPERLRDWLLAEGVTLGFVPTPVMEGLLALDWSGRWSGSRGPRLLLTGGDRLRARPATGLPFRLINNYGPTESAVVATSGEVEPETADRLPSIGRPIAGTRVLLLDSRLRPVPPGVAGELCLAGAGLARGYLGQPDLTAERFVPDPSGSVGGRLYRTGDLARIRPDGRLDFLGRTDQQVKIHGIRVEPAEIERALARHPEVREALVLPLGDHRLAAFVVATEGEEAPAPRALRDHLAERLPAALIPGLFLSLPALPLTANGKVDRRALAALAAQAPREVSADAGDDPLGELIAGVWAEVLELPRVGLDEDFFALGGHSLLATRVISRLRALLGIDLPVRALFEAPTPALLAVRARASRQTWGTAGEQPPLLPVPRPAPGEAGLPLSFAQQRLWFLHQLDPASPAYHVPGVLRITGPLDATALARTLAAVAARHEALRTTFQAAGDGPVQRIAPAAAPLALPRIDLAGLPVEARTAEAARLTREEARRPFDLGRGPVLRALLFRLAPAEHALMVTLHHIVADGWSLGVLLREIGALYPAGSLSALPAPPVQPADVAVWQRGWLRGEVLERLLGWWRDRLAGAEAVLRLPTDRPRAAQAPVRGRTLHFLLDAEVTDAVDALARRQGATPFILLLAAWDALLRRASGQSDLSVGSPIANRNRVETEGVIGCLVNTLVLRNRVAGGEPFTALLARVREGTLGAYDHQDLPFEILVEALRPERDLSLTPLFQVFFALQNAPRPRLDLPGLHLALEPVETGAPKADLALTLEREGEELAAALEYPLELFDPATAARLASWFVTLLTGALAAPETAVDQLPLLSLEERVQILEDWSPAPAAAAALAWETELLHERFAAWAARTPDAPALRDEGEENGELSYGALDRRANRLAHHLIALGIRPGDRVGLCLERSAPAVEGILGTLKAGAAWVPLDPAHPLERLAYMATDAGLAALLTRAELAAAMEGLAGGPPRILLDADRALLDQRPDSPPALTGTGGASLPGSMLAYVIYTSGSTGRPKGVAGHHAGVLHLIEAFDEIAAPPPGTVGSLTTSLSFDAAVWEIFTPLVTGGVLDIAPERAREGGGAMARWMAERGVGSAFLAPGLVADFAAALWEQAPPLRRLLTGVEPIPEPLLSAIVERLGERCPGARVINAYGPTETTICSTRYLVPEGPVPAERERMTPIGRAFHGERVYLLGGGLEPVPQGVPGEIWIGGAGVARGYLGRPELTAERFVPDPFAAALEPGARMYRTGDLGRWLPGGEIAFLGRLDHQLKVRGVRVEPGEIEAALRDCPGVREAVVAPLLDPHGETRLVAWIGGAPETSPREHLRARLPEVMVPSVILQLEALPLNVHGKVDRAALPDPDWQRPELSGESVPPRTPVEEMVAEVWKELLGVERIGIHDSFFDLGGHSLKAGQLVLRVRERFGVELPVRTVFEAPTVAAMAVAIGRKLVEELDPELLAEILTEI